MCREPWFAARVGNAVCSLGMRFRVLSEWADDAADWLVDLSLRIDPEGGSLARMQEEAAKIRTETRTVTGSGWGTSTEAIVWDCSCYEAGRDPLCPVHGSYAGAANSQERPQE